MHLATNWLVVTAGVVAALVPSLGGYLLYTDSLALVERTVEEVGRADAQALYREAKRIFSVADEYMYKYKDLLKGYSEILTSRTELGRWMKIHGLADLFNGFTLDGIAITGIHSTNRSESFVYYVWVDPLENGSRDYVYAEMWSDVDTPDCPYPCVVCYKVDDTGTLLQNIYNYSTYNFTGFYMQQVGVIPPGKGYSFNPRLWASSDGTPYVYIYKDILLPPIGGLFEGLYVFPSIDMATFSFDDFMLGYNSDANIILTQVGRGLDSFIISANFEAGRLDRTCKYDPYIQPKGQQPCIKTLHNLTHDHQEVVIFLNKSVDWKFHRFEGFWTLRATVYREESYDELSSVYLMWYRSVSQVKGDLDHALFLFVGFIAGVIVFDFLIGAAEILLIARPLTKLADATGPLRMMWLEDAESMVEAAGGGVVQIREVVAMRTGLMFAINSLKEYKSFMPSTLFACNEEECSNASSPKSSGHDVQRSESSLSSSISCIQVGTSLGLSSSRHAAVAIGLVYDRSFTMDRVTSLLGKIEECAKASQGQLHGFSAISVDTLLVTWQGFKRDEMSVKFCFSAKDTIDVSGAFGLVTCSSWQTGNIGTKTYRGFTMQGRTTQHLHRALAFAYYAVEVCGKSCIITTVDSAKLLSAVAVTTPVGRVIEDEDVKAINVEEVASMRGEAKGEWMYTLSSEDKYVPLAEMLSNNDVRPEYLLAFTPLTMALKGMAESKCGSDRCTVFTVVFAPHKFRRVEGGGNASVLLCEDI